MSFEQPMNRQTDNFKSTSCSGFTFIEVMVAVVIISITALGMMHGTIHSRGTLRVIEVRERAIEELTNYMEYWKGRIADDKLSTFELAGNNIGQQVYLVGDVNSDASVSAMLYYSLQPESSNINNANYKAYKIKVWIRWQDFFLQKGDAYQNDVVRERTLETVMIAYK